MKKAVISVIILSLLLVGLLVIKNAFDNQQCSLEEDRVCFDAGLGRFEFEPGATILVGVNSQETADGLIALWQQAYPTHPNILKAAIIDEVSANEVADIGEDIFLINHDQAAFVMDSFYGLDNKLLKEVGNRVNLSLVGDLNANKNVMIPGFVSGLSMLINDDSLKAKGIGVETYTSFENIFANFDQLKVAYPVVYPMLFEDFEAVYPLLSVGGWHPFDTFEQRDAHFESDAFLEGLTFISELGNYQWDAKNPTNNPDQFIYQFDTVLIRDESPVSIKHAYVNLGVIENITKQKIHYSTYPTYRGQQLTSIVDVMGWVMHTDTRYPSAGHEVLRFLRTPEVLSHISQQTDKVPAITLDSIHQLDLARDIFEQTVALNHSIVSPMVVRRDDPTKLLTDVYEDIDLMSVVKDVYAHNLTPKQGQSEIVARYQAWLTDGAS